MAEDTEEEARALGQLVREQIRAAGLTQAALAARLKMPEPRLSLLLSEGRNLKVPLLIRIAKALGRRPAEFLASLAPPPGDLVGYVVTTEAAEREHRAPRSPPRG